jgi:hypothetical protein
MSKKIKTPTVIKLSAEEQLAVLVRKEQSRRQMLEGSIEQAVAFLDSESLPTMDEIEADATQYGGLFSEMNFQQEADNIDADLRDWQIAVNNLLEAKGLGVTSWKAANKEKAA